MTSTKRGGRPCRLVWHRRDLRLDDNEMYRDLQQQQQVVSLFVLNPDEFHLRAAVDSHNLYSVRRGPQASRLLVDALTDLRQDLRARGSDLIIARGNPLDIVPAVARQVGATDVRWCQEPGVYETNVSQALAQHFSMHTDMLPVVECSCSLYHPNDLPYGHAQWSRLAHPKQKQGKRKNKIPNQLVHSQQRLCRHVGRTTGWDAPHHGGVP